ncbi:MAG TPA: stage III sporulation protein AF, partial [Virgibacillus sp.]|nr:stage III sporulation protein AF [Virgibacillus sp.]
MDMLTQWVTQIIVFILLATIIDLIIPATAMKKYVKLVIGLILILIFLKPVFYLFDINIQQSLETSISQLYEEEMGEENIENLTKMQKKEIQASQDAYILEEMAVQLKTLAEDPLLENYQAVITNIDFEFSTEEKDTYEDLEEVIVYLQESEGEEGTVDAVEEVVINTDEPVENEKEEHDIEGVTALLQE